MGKRKSSKSSSSSSSLGSTSHGMSTGPSRPKGGGGGGSRRKISTSNPHARESDERRLQQLTNLEIKRLSNLVLRQEENMRRFIPIEYKNKKLKIDPNYQLKGAARPALEYYQDPNYIPEPEPIDLLSQYEGKLWEHYEGQILLEKLLDYGVGLHNIGMKSKDAIKIFEKMLRNDPNDHLVRYMTLLYL